MGETDKKIAYFSECIQLINVDGRYVPDVYHIVLHILIIVAFVVTLLYRKEKTLVDEVWNFQSYRECESNRRFEFAGGEFEFLSLSGLI